MVTGLWGCNPQQRVMAWIRNKSIFSVKAQLSPLWTVLKPLRAAGEGGKRAAASLAGDASSSQG